MVQSVERTLDVLEALAAADNDLSLSQLREQLDLPLGTLHRLLAGLIARGYAAQDRSTRLYGPGPRLLEVAALAGRHQRFNLVRVARPLLRELTDATEETSNLLVLQGLDGVYRDQAASPRMVRMFTEVGQRVPLYCTGGGKAILSGFSEAQLAAYLAAAHLEAYTPKTISEPQALRAELEQARQQGFAIDDEEREAGVCCVAAPVFDHSGQCLAALSISGPTTRMNRARAVELGPLVQAAAARCSAALGYSRYGAAGGTTA